MSKSKSGRNFVDGLLGTMARADYQGDYWRMTAAMVLPLLSVAFYWWLTGASLSNAIGVWFVLFAAVYVYLTLSMIRRTSAEQTRSWALSQKQEVPPSVSRLRRSFYRATSYYPGERGGEYLAGFPMITSMLGLGLAFGLVSGEANEDDLPILFSILSVALLWAMLHTSYALYYAYLYYAEDRPGGLDFPGGEEPDHADFAYFAFAVGTTFGTSDVTVTSKRLRRTTLVHGVLSFVYGTAVLAIVINALIRGF